MTEQTREDLLMLSECFKNISYKKGKISKTDIRYPIEVIFDIIERGDFEVQVNRITLNIARNWVKRWLES